MQSEQASLDQTEESTSGRKEMEKPLSTQILQEGLA